MFREMRRKRQLLPQEQALEILENGTSGVLALSGDGGYPYAVPLSYVYQEGTLFFHCAKAGHKLDALRRCSKASFCVIDQDQVVPPEYTTYFRSVIAFGRTRILEDEAEKQAAIWLLAEKYCPGDSPEHRQEAIRREAGGLCLVSLSIEHMTGKQAFSFYNRKTGKAVRLVLRPTPAEYQTKEERFRYLQDAAPASLFDVKPAVLSLPKKARLFQSLPCDGCGEVTAEHLLRLENGKKLCLDCFRAYNRFDV